MGKEREIYLSQQDRGTARELSKCLHTYTIYRDAHVYVMFSIDLSDFRVARRSTWPGELSRNSHVSTIQLTYDGRLTLKITCNKR